MQAGVDALTAALGSRLRPRGPGFADLFTDDAVLEVPFDGDGTSSAIRGRVDIAAMVASLVDVLHFDQVTVERVMDVDEATVVCEYGASLQRHDLGRRLRRRYIGVFSLRDGLVLHLREYGGPFLPDVDSEGRQRWAGRGGEPVA